VILEEIGATGAGRFPQALQDRLNRNAPIVARQETFGGEAHTVQNLVPPQQSLGHRVDGDGEAAQLVVTLNRGAGGEVAAGDLLHDGAEAQNGPDEPLGIDDGGQEAEQDANDREQAGALVNQGDVFIVAFEGEADMNPTPLDARVIERLGVVEHALA